MVPIQLKQIQGQLPLGSPEGLLLSVNAAVSGTILDLAAGRVIINGASSDRFVGVNSSTFSKDLGALWAAGSGNGGRAAGTLGNFQTWHVFIIRNRTSGAIDFVLDTSITAANRPSGWDARIIGSIITDGSAKIRKFLQVGDRFDWITTVIDLNVTNLTTTTTNLVSVTAPSGLKVIHQGVLQVFATYSGGNVFSGSPELDARVVLASMANLYPRSFSSFITDTSNRIRAYSGSTSLDVVVYTHGFIHPRGAY